MPVVLKGGDEIVPFAPHQRPLAVASSRHKEAAFHSGDKCKSTLLAGKNQYKQR